MQQWSCSQCQQLDNTRLNCKSLTPILSSTLSHSTRKVMGRSSSHSDVWHLFVYVIIVIVVFKL